MTVAFSLVSSGCADQHGKVNIRGAGQTNYHGGAKGGSLVGGGSGGDAAIVSRDRLTDANSNLLKTVSAKSEDIDAELKNALNCGEAATINDISSGKYHLTNVWAHLAQVGGDVNRRALVELSVKDGNLSESRVLLTGKTNSNVSNSDYTDDSGLNSDSAAELISVSADPSSINKKQPPIKGSRGRNQTQNYDKTYHLPLLMTFKAQGMGASITDQLSDVAGAGITVGGLISTPRYAWNGKSDRAVETYAAFKNATLGDKNGYLLQSGQKQQILHVYVCQDKTLRLVLDNSQIGVSITSSFAPDTATDAKPDSSAAVDSSKDKKTTDTASSDTKTTTAD